MIPWVSLTSCVPVNWGQIDGLFKLPNCRILLMVSSIDSCYPLDWYLPLTVSHHNRAHHSGHTQITGESARKTQLKLKGQVVFSFHPRLAISQMVFSSEVVRDVCNYRVFSKGRNEVGSSKSLIFWTFSDVLDFFWLFNMGDFSFWYFWVIWLKKKLKNLILQKG